MGYYTFSFAVDIKKVKNIFGSKEQGLFNEIIETQMFKNYADQDMDWHTTTKEALEHIIFEKPYNNASPHSYWYALIAICAYVGEQLPSTHEIKLGYETDLINSFLQSDYGINIKIEEVLINSQSPFDLPSVKDWPLCGTLTKTELTDLEKKFKDIHITDEMLEELLDKDEEKEMSYDSIKQVKENISHCLAENVELISFCH